MIDALVKVLNKHGYMPVMLPKTGIDPPQVYTVDRRRRSIRPWGLLENFVKGKAKKRLRELKIRKARIPNIEHKHTSRKELDLATLFLKDALACIGVTSVPHVDLSFCGQVQIIFAFTGVSSRRIDVGELLPVFEEFTVDHIPDKYVFGGGVHVAYEYLYAKQLLMRRADGREFATKVSGKVGEFIDVGAGASISVKDETTLFFSGNANAPIAFAYRSGRMLLDGSEWDFYIHDPLLSTSRQAKPAMYVPLKGIVPTTETAM